ncbi:saccharolysin [Trichomonascus vanleenenianus]|uniref:metalloendopeptidase n=1 Tax=Trichomonascus vanleenenianus TaxID=2268995 RepID=UPI003EC9FCBB
MSTPIPPQPAPSWATTPEKILGTADKAIAENKRVDDEIAQEANPTFDSVIKKYVTWENKEQVLTGPLTFYQRVSTDKGLREASTKAEEKLENYFIDAASREDVYVKVKAVWENLPKGIDPESKRLVEKLVKKYERNGLGLEKAKREKVTQLRKELSNISIQFAKNLDNENGFLLFTKEELEGIPERVYEQLEQVDGKYKMTFKMPDVQPVLKYAKSGATRKAVFVGYENRCTNNNELLEKAIKLRAEIAQLLGYKCHADFVLEERMAKTSEAVGAFLNDLRKKMSDKGKKEVAGLLELKNKDLEERGLPKESELYNWDLRFYDNLLLEREYQVDHEKIKEYFPTEQTISGMLKLFERLFSLEFTEVTENKQVWHPDVRQYSVWKTESGKPEFLGWFYLDLHPRENKYSHAANFSLTKGYYDEEGKRVHPATALVCNFSKPTPTKPSLLDHSEVTTLFHELGHGIHDLVGDAKYSRFNGNSVDWDFVEAPSQMLEFWTWNREQLKDLSGHYKNPEQKLEDTLIDSLVRSKHVNGAMFMLRQLHFGLFDFTLHTASGVEEAAKLDIAKLWNELRQDISHVSQGDEQRVHGYSSFGHIMGGYDSGYYGYLWSEVFAADMYYTKFKTNPLDAAAGMEYRTKIIGRGGAGDQMDSLRDYLGREPNNQAFLEEMGIH